MADLALVRRALTRDRQAIDELGSRLVSIPKMVASANRKLSHPLPPHEVADVAQDTVLLIWQKLETFEGRSTLEGWAWRFGFLELRNRIRRVARQRARDGSSLSALEIDPAAREDDAMDAWIEPKRLEDALDRLPAEMSSVVRLKHQSGLMFKEIAAQLGIPENTAKTRYYRGLTRMRASLTGTTEGSSGRPSAR